MTWLIKTPEVEHIDSVNWRRALFSGSATSTMYTAPKALNTPVHNPVKNRPIKRYVILLAKPVTRYPTMKGHSRRMLVYFLPSLSLRTPDRMQPNAIESRDIDAAMENTMF